MKGVCFMPKKKYTTELKLQIVKEYLKGRESFKTLTEKYCVCKGDIQKWTAAYQEHGIEGLCTTHGTYSGQFKIDVVEYMHNTSSSARQTAAHFNIPSYTSVCKWERIYLDEGKEALFQERRGLANRMSGSKKGRNPKLINQKEQEDLLTEVKRLRMENEYLKKLNALVQEREKSKKPTK
jgi:transposase